FLKVGTSIGCLLFFFLQVTSVSPLQIVVNIGPEFLQFIAKSIDTHLRSPAVCARRSTTIGGGVIYVGDGNRRGIAGKLGDVERVLAGICSGNENTAEGIAKAVQERASAQLKITRISF